MFRARENICKHGYFDLGYEPLNTFILNTHHEFVGPAVHTTVNTNLPVNMFDWLGAGASLLPTNLKHILRLRSVGLVRARQQPTTMNLQQQSIACP